MFRYKCQKKAKQVEVSRLKKLVVTGMESSPVWYTGLYDDFTQSRNGVLALSGLWRWGNYFPRILGMAFFLLFQMFASSWILVFPHPSRDKDAAD